MSTNRAPFALAAALLLAGCEGAQTSLAGDGAEGMQVIRLGILFLAVTTLAYLLVLAFLAAAIWRRRPVGEERDQAVGKRNRASDPPRFRTMLIGWVAFVTIGLAVLTIASFFTDRGMAQTAARPAISIEITANQWWWDVEYEGSEPSRTVRTANELHLPVGVPAHITLKSNDVIHSFWVPNLAGKQDLIPGRVTDITLLPKKTGIYRAQCAEFCGVQHAHMALDVTVESRADFTRWWNAAIQPARPPTTPLALAGYNYVTTRECRMCHNITGTPASGRVAPDLTHFASRRSIAAGTMPMNRGNLYGWIADPQSQKPGSKMPYIGLEPAELHAVVAYLEGLK